ncbi:membrane stabilizing protein MspA [Staphylococcus sp. SQ8-PEA]|uniref:Membrane stabilizing protein MspA n=1 Tax=Staphylococcus marylandisciuri TaxID=2981529 RepID=A0ABT2QMG3_9STAP|nr:membrane stabilizing protein MspA [Staphylococcus marylandisciuri]MCU5745169.1 membrane stabilizing protein MspA [Staphylococcus marylandisciuri]
MQLYLILLPILYLIVSYISIFKMNTIFTTVLRVIMGLLLLFVVALTTVSFPASYWWVFAVLVLLIANVEVTNFKFNKQDKKGVNILNLISLIIFVIYIILVLVIY